MAGRDEIQEWAESSNKNPDDFDVELVGGTGPMTDEQAHRLKALCWQHGIRFDPSLTADEAEHRIRELRQRI